MSDRARPRAPASPPAALAEAGARAPAPAVSARPPAARSRRGAPTAPAPAAARKAPARDTPKPLKMQHLVERTGVPRQVIHFYIQQGLVPEGKKTGRNMAYYDESHVERVALVRKLQHERFLPLKVIKAMLDQTDEAFSPSQKRLLSEVKEHLSGASALLSNDATIDAEALAKARNLAPSDLDELAEAGFIALRRGADGSRAIAARDAWLIDLWGEFRAAGLTKELGFTPQDLTVYEDIVTRLFRSEIRLLTERLAHLPPKTLATLVERAMPLVNTLITRWHMGKAHAIFATLGESK